MAMTFLSAPPSSTPGTSVLRVQAKCFGRKQGLGALSILHLREGDGRSRRRAGCDLLREGRPAQHTDPRRAAQHLRQDLGHAKQAPILDALGGRDNESARPKVWAELGGRGPEVLRGHDAEHQLRAPDSLTELAGDAQRRRKAKPGR